MHDRLPGPLITACHSYGAVSAGFRTILQEILFVVPFGVVLYYNHHARCIVCFCRNKSPETMWNTKDKAATSLRLVAILSFVCPAVFFSTTVDYHQVVCVLTLIVVYLAVLVSRYCIYAVLIKANSIGAKTTTSNSETKRSEGQRQNETEKLNYIGRKRDRERSNNSIQGMS